MSTKKMQKVIKFGGLFTTFPMLLSLSAFGNTTKKVVSNLRMYDHQKSYLFF